MGSSAVVVISVMSIVNNNFLRDFLVLSQFFTDIVHCTAPPAYQLIRYLTALPRTLFIGSFLETCFHPHFHTEHKLLLIFKMYFILLLVTRIQYIPIFRQ